MCSLGQRGDDQIRGGDGDDMIFGDGVSNLLPFGTEIPQVANGCALSE